MKNLVLNTSLLAESGIPKPYWAMGADTYIGDKSALKKVDHYSCVKHKEAYTQGVGLLLQGPPQSAKTFLLTYCLKQLMLRGFDCYYVSLAESVDTFFDNALAPEWRRHVSNADFLALDNVEITGQQKGTSLVLGQVVRLRKDHKMPLLMATTLSIEDMAAVAKFDAATLSYISDELLPVATQADPMKADQLRRKRKEAFLA